MHLWKITVNERYTLIEQSSPERPWYTWTPFINTL